MSYVFSDLIANAALMKQGNEDYLGSKTNDELTSLMYDVALQEVKNDLCVAKGFLQGDTGDMTILDEIVDKYYAELCYALMYKQLYYFYSGIQSGADSKAYIKMTEYRNLYNNKKNKFSAYTSSYQPATNFVKVWRT